ncbi:UBA-like domain DUF1421 [Dillenia turbinata]|uniref:UBA-like domain DUF1421 n=1 Tax=Dillenia turbinata TaxID=194707 RepID=A0AAN8UPA1_9MAGN
MIVSVIDHKMKEHAEILLQRVDSLTTRLSQLERRMCNIKTSMDDFKSSAAFNYGRTERNLKHLETMFNQNQTSPQSLDNSSQLESLSAQEDSNRDLISLTPPTREPCLPPMQTPHHEFSPPIVLHPWLQRSMSGNSSCFGNSNKDQSRSMFDGSTHFRLPIVRLLPEALPTDSSDAQRSVAIDDIVEKAIAMGFRRDFVSSTVKKLLEDGQKVELNLVLDTLMGNE